MLTNQNERETIKCSSYSGDTDINDDGTNDILLSRNKDTNKCEDRTNDERNARTSENGDGISPIVIYRYKFTEEFMEQLHNFSKIHQYDHRKDFKEAWKTWTEENDDLIGREATRLTTLGYDGDVLDKMFKSARYYFRKKSTEKKEPKQRRIYISVNRELLDAMDQHIEENISREEYQPKTGFAEFCTEQQSLLKETIETLFEKNIKDLDLIEDKIKKTYKNRYFMFAANRK